MEKLRKFNTQGIEAVVFDTDGTLTRRDFNSWDYLTVMLGIPLEDHHAVRNDVKTGRLSPNQGRT